MTPSLRPTPDRMPSYMSPACRPLHLPLRRSPRVTKHTVQSTSIPAPAGPAHRPPVSDNLYTSPTTTGDNVTVGSLAHLKDRSFVHVPHKGRHPSADAGHDPSHTPNRPSVQRLRFGVGSLAAVPLADVLVFTMHESSRTGAQRRPYLMPVQRHSTAQAVAACLARSRTWPRFDPCNALLVSRGENTHLVLQGGATARSQAPGTTSRAQSLWPTAPRRSYATQCYLAPLAFAVLSPASRLQTRHCSQEDDVDASSLPPWG